MKKDKKRFFQGVGIFLLTSLVFYLAAIIHLFLSGKGFLYDLRGQSFMKDPHFLKLFLGLEILMLLFVFYNYVQTSKRGKYVTKSQIIAGTIEIPVPVGDGQYGQSRFLTEDEMSVRFSRSLKEKGAGGFVLGQNKKSSKEDAFFVSSDSHTLTIGSTGSGKTRCHVLESMALLGRAGENMLVADPKGQLADYSEDYLKTLDYDVWRLDFKEFKSSHAYNFLGEVIQAVDAEDIPSAIDATWDIVSQLVGEPKGEKLWANGEASVIGASILAVVYDNREGKNRVYQNLTNVYYFLSEMCVSTNGEMPLKYYLEDIEETHPARALLGVSRVAPWRTQGSFYTSALMTLRLFTNPYIYAMTSRSDFKLVDVVKKKTAIFIVLPDEKRTYYPVAALFISRFYQQLIAQAEKRGGRCPIRWNFMLDEIGNFTKIVMLDSMITAGRERGIRLNLFVQDFAQLYDKYGDHVTRTIKGNCSYWIYLRTKDPGTLKELSEKLDTYTTSSHSQNVPGGGDFKVKQQVNLISRNLLKPSEVEQIDRPYSLVIDDTTKAIFYAPDLTAWSYNKLLGLGDREHNRALREQKRHQREKKEKPIKKIELWGIWHYYLQMLLLNQGMEFPGEEVMLRENKEDKELTTKRKESDYEKRAKEFKSVID